MYHSLQKYEATRKAVAKHLILPIFKGKTLSFEFHFLLSLSSTSQ